LKIKFMPQESLQEVPALQLPPTLEGVSEVFAKPIKALVDGFKWLVILQAFSVAEEEERRNPYANPKCYRKDFLAKWAPASFITNVTRLFEECGIRVSEPMLIKEGAGSYEYDPVPENNWLYDWLQGAQVLQSRLDAEGKECEHFASVGSGGGIDAVAAAHIFDPKRMSISDIDSGLAGLAERNILRNIPHRLKLVVSSGHLFGGTVLPEDEDVFDVVYANLPNIPAADTVLDKPMARATFIDESVREGCPEHFDRYLLALQYQFLQKAKQYLKTGGSAVIALGGRIPYEVIEDMFATCDLRLEELHARLKVQTQPKDVIGGYAKAEEENGVDFTFYCLDEVAEIQLEGLSCKEMQEALKPFALSANEALGYMKAGREVAHLVYMLRGVKE
jgi:methylase of polypeptide subunit release factors